MHICNNSNLAILSRAQTRNGKQLFGFTKVNAENMQYQSVIPAVHQGQIRNIHGNLEGSQVLSVGWDCKLMITDIVRTDSIVQSYNLPSKGWSCAWDTEKQIVFAGLQNSEIVGYDIRNTFASAIRIKHDSLRGSVHTLQYDQQNGIILAAHFGAVIAFILRPSDYRAVVLYECSQYGI
jgi:hypothetical protein